MSNDMSVEPDEQEQGSGYKPWYKDKTNDHPFKLVRKIVSQSTTTPDYHSLAIFPWDISSLESLWDGSQNHEDVLPGWKNMLSEYWDAVAVGSSSRLYVHFTRQKKSPLCVQLPSTEKHSDRELRIIDADRMCVAWALCEKAPTEPLIVFSRGSLVYVYSVVRAGIGGYLRGHGAPITSISVHPTTPQLFCTTSRDHTARVYDLTLSPQKVFEKEHFDPPWPPGKHPSQAGAAHGLQMPEGEGSEKGLGRCIVVLVGGRSGGHQAAVLGSAFHPTLPLVATCGMDRAVKIWVVRPTSPLHLKREDKPIFSTSRIHKARVLSISWLQHDMLLTHSAPAIMRAYPEDGTRKETYVEAGEVTIWRWLSVDRFFPVMFDRASKGTQQRLEMLMAIRGSACDYQDSSSFKVISTHAFRNVESQYEVCRLSLYQSLVHDPLISYIEPDKRDEILVSNLVQFKPRERPLFPVRPPGQKEKGKGTQGTEDERLADVTGQMNLDDNGEGRYFNKVVPPPIDSWKVATNPPIEGARLLACEMGVGGQVIVGVGEKGSVHVWSHEP